MKTESQRARQRRGFVLIQPRGAGLRQYSHMPPQYSVAIRWGESIEDAIP